MPLCRETGAGENPVSALFSSSPLSISGGRRSSSSMAADVSFLAQREEEEGKRELVTRDLLGGGEASRGSAEVDLELTVPDGWERRLDLAASTQSSYSFFFLSTRSVFFFFYMENTIVCVW